MGNDQKKAADEAASHDDDVVAYLEHAKLFWTAEEENAERLSKQVRLLTTLAATVIAAIGYRFSQTYARQLESVTPVMMMWLVIVFILFFGALILPWKRRLIFFLMALDAVIFSYGMWVQNAPSSYFHSAFTGAMIAALSWMFFFLLVTMNQLLIPVQSRKQPKIRERSVNGDTNLIARAYRRIRISIKNVTRKVVSGDIADDAPSDTASSGFVLSSGSLAYASRILGRGQWSTFGRQYLVAMELQARNIQLRDRVRTAQRSLWTAFSLVPVILLLLIQADASREPEKKPETSSQLAAYTKGVCQ